MLCYLPLPECDLCALEIPEVEQAVAAVGWAVWCGNHPPPLPHLAMQDGIANFSSAQLNWDTELSRMEKPARVNCFTWSPVRLAHQTPSFLKTQLISDPFNIFFKSS